jgi:hypothetical protein
MNREYNIPNKVEAVYGKDAPLTHYHYVKRIISNDDYYLLLKHSLELKKIYFYNTNLSIEKFIISNVTENKSDYYNRSEYYLTITLFYGLEYEEFSKIHHLCNRKDNSTYYNNIITEITLPLHHLSTKPFDTKAGALLWGK